MPLLTQPPNQKELEAIQIAAYKRAEVHGQMDALLPIPSRLPFWRRRLTNPKVAIETGEGQDGNPFIRRAWLERYPRDPKAAITIMVDEVSGNKTLCPQPKLGLDAEGTLYGEEFLYFTPSQHIGLMDSAQATVASIRLGAGRAANYEPVAIDTAVPERFFARVFSSLSS